jgi:hypothetical protein
MLLQLMYTFGRYRARILAYTILTKVYRDFTQFLQTNYIP